MREIIERYFQLFYEYRPGKQIPDNGKQLCDAIEGMLNRNPVTKFYKPNEVESLMARGVLGEFGKAYHYDPETVNKWILEYDKDRAKNNIEEMRARHGFKNEYKPTDQDRAVGRCAIHVMKRTLTFSPQRGINEREELETLSTFEPWQWDKMEQFYRLQNQEENPYYHLLLKVIKRNQTVKS